MSTFAKLQKGGDSVSELAQGLKNAIATKGTDFLNTENAQFSISIESLDADRQSGAQQQFTGMRDMLADLAEKAEISLEDREAAHVEAAVIVAMGLGDAGAYHSAAIKPTVSVEGRDVIDVSAAGIAGEVEGFETISTESFDTDKIDNYAHYSIAFNLLASRQDSFAEAFYPTIAMTPDQSGLDVRVEQPFIMREVRHALTGAVTDFQKKRIIDANVDATILENESTRIIPGLLADNSNAKYFVDPALVPVTTKELDGIKVRTAPLAMGVSMNLLGLASTAGNLNGQQLDHTDSIDTRVSLQTVYVKVSDGTDTEVMALETLNLPRSSFFKSTEGKARETSLAFANSSLTVDKDSKAIDSSAMGTLASLTTHRLQLSIRVSGELDLEKGNLNLFAPGVELAGLYDSAGDKVAMDEGAGKAIVDGLSFEVIGFDLKAFRANKNMRSRGLITDVDSFDERYTVHFGSPISAVVPTDEASKREAADLKALIRTTRTRTSNNAVTTLINYAETLKVFAAKEQVGDEVASIEGTGRHLVQPYFVEKEIDLQKVINSEKTHEKAADVSAVLVNAIRAMVYPMAEDSRYQSALEQTTNNPEAKPKLLIGTDGVIQQHLMVSGDDRTVSIGMDFKIVTSPDSRMKDWIYFTFVRGNKNEVDPLSFGCHAWMPELVSSATITKGGSTTHVTTVQPRSRHCNVLPIMGRIHVKNLDKVLTEAVAQ